jgi:UDP-2,3-diacylglucosamine hydrolase
LTSVFASDLHLSGSTPEKITLFEAFVGHAAKCAQELFILGDLFEIWLGDDDDNSANVPIISALKRFSDVGGKLFVMHGNRDFLLGEDFAHATGATLLSDWHIVKLANEPTLLAHGDLLCTKDVEYQAFRKHVRNPQTQSAFLALPLATRRDVAANMRSGTQAAMLEKDEFIMDVDHTTVDQIMREHNVAQMIHGHTHRPATHKFDAHGTTRERIVLGDWYEHECSIIVSSNHELKRMSAASFIGS